MWAARPDPATFGLSPSFEGAAHTPLVTSVQVSRLALDTHRSGIAVLDADGNVTWTDEAWDADDEATGFPRVPLGGHLLQAHRPCPDPAAATIAEAHRV